MVHHQLFLTRTAKLRALGVARVSEREATYRMNAEEDPQKYIHG